MKTLIKIVLFLCTLSLYTSCKGLQYRESTDEIMQRHETLAVQTQITTYEAKNLDRFIRVQAVKNDNSSINVVFFHGSPSSMAAWSGYMTDNTLIKEASLYAIDRPGYGYSGFGDVLTSIETQAELMSDLITSYKLENVILVGASYGGPLAARMAVLNPDVKAVIMVSPAIDPKQEKKIWASRLTQWWLTRWMVPTGYRVAGDEKTVHAEELAKLEDDWDEVTVPVIHIHGDVDDVVPYGNVNYSEKVFSNIKIITIPNAGHEIAWRRSELVKPEIIQIIENLSEAIKN